VRASGIASTNARNAKIFISRAEDRIPPLPQLKSLFLIKMTLSRHQTDYDNRAFPLRLSAIVIIR